MEVFFFQKKKVSNLPDESHQNVSKKIFSDELFLFSAKVQNLAVFEFIYMIRIRFFWAR